MPSEDGAPMVGLLTDFGTGDPYVGVMKAVILGIAPRVPLVDLSHEVPPQDVRTGAWLLHTAWQFLPTGSICLCVVDPGVGSDRRGIAFAAAGRIFVGPDNGLFSYVLDASAATSAVVLDNPRYHRPHVSATFHGRDVFAPAAGHLAAGVALAALGTAIDPRALVTLDLPRPGPHPEGLLGHVVYVDHFGNLITDFGPEMAPAVLCSTPLRLRIGALEVTTQAETFAAGPEGVAFALLDSSGHLAIAVHNGSAAELLSAGLGAGVLAIGVTPRS